jgi:hypothetical protein
MMAECQAVIANDRAARGDCGPWIASSPVRRETGEE